MRLGLVCFSFLVAVPLSLVAQPSLPQMVAAGDVTTDSAVLWARVSSKGPVLFRVIGRGTPPPRVHNAHFVVKDPTIPANVEISGLQDGTTYDYTVSAPSGESLHGTFRTPAAVGRKGLHFGVSGNGDVPTRRSGRRHSRTPQPTYSKPIPHPKNEEPGVSAGLRNCLI